MGDRLRNASQHPALEAGSPMATHDNEIGPPRLGNIEDALCYQPKQNLSFRLDPRESSRLSNALEIAGCLLYARLNYLFC